MGTVAGVADDGVVGVDDDPPQPVSANAKTKDPIALFILMDFLPWFSRNIRAFLDWATCYAEESATEADLGLTSM